MIKKCLAVRHVAFEDLGLLGPLLAARGYDVHYLDACVQPFDPETLIASDLVIVLGGPIGVYERDAYPFIGEEIAAVAARIESNKPILGICLGAQLMAAALGARVAPGPVKEIGFVNRCYGSRDDLMAGVAGIARSIAAKSPLAIRGSKEMLIYTRDHSVAESLKYMAIWNAALLQSDDLSEAFAAFMAKRNPKFRD